MAVQRALLVNPPLPKSAIILPPSAFELVYGDELASVIDRESLLLHPRVSFDALTAADASWLAEVEVLFTGWGGPRLDAAFLDRMPALRAVFHAGGTVRMLATEEFWERDIILTTAASANAAPVAEFTFASIVLALKRAWHQARLVRDLRGFPEPALPVAGALGSTVGIVSLGRIARMVCDRLQSLEVEILAYDPVVGDGLFVELGTRAASLEDLFSRSDVVSIHTPWLPETQGLITGDLIRRMKHGATVINTARGAVIEQDQLCEVLRERPDLQAVLDVTYPEPPPPDSALYDLPNVFLTPHIAGSQARECRRLGRWVIDDYRRYTRGDSLREQITRAMALRLA